MGKRTPRPEVLVRQKLAENPHISSPELAQLLNVNLTEIKRILTYYRNKRKNKNNDKKIQSSHKQRPTALQTINNQEQTKTERPHLDENEIQNKENSQEMRRIPDQELLNGLPDNINTLVSKILEVERAMRTVATMRCEISEQTSGIQERLFQLQERDSTCGQ